MLKPSPASSVRSALLGRFPLRAATFPDRSHNIRLIVRCFWALERSLASARHFPSVDSLDSYSEYIDDVADWWRGQVEQDWYSLRAQAMDILNEEDHLSHIVKLVGPDALPDEQRLTLETARICARASCSKMPWMISMRIRP